jgi:hypothetical protein
MRRYKSLYSFRKDVSRLIDAGEIDKSLRSIHDIVEQIITEPLCTTQVFGSKALDDLCRRIGKASLEQIRQRIDDTGHDQPDRPVFVYVVTRLQKSGGHTRIIEDFIGAQPAGRHIILSTELAGRSDVNYVMKGLAGQTAVVFERAPKASYRQRLTWLQERLLKIRPNRVYLFNHHQDSVAVAAIQPEMKLEACFYHHGDHHLCLGVHLSHLRHIDPHPVVYHNCRNVLGIENTYVPFTFEDRGARPVDLPFLSDGTLTTCTAARLNKIEVPYFISYLDLVPDLLKATGGRHVHVGLLTPWALFRIRRGLKRYGIQPDRFIYSPWVPSVWKALHHHRVDLYIASFPYGGALTLIEAMGAGIPVALHRRISSRIHSGIDLAYPGAFSWRWPDELLNYCVSLTPADLEQAGRSGRTHYEKFHSGGRLHGILNTLGDNGLRPHDLVDTFSIESDELAVWMERQVSIRNLLLRAAYRAFLRLSARWW